MEQTLMSTQGVDGRVDVFAECIRIRRGGSFARGRPAQEQMLPLAAIHAIRCEKPGLVSDGYLQVTFVLHTHSPASELGRQEYSVVFAARQLADIQRLQAVVSSRLVPAA